ncbi:thioredoxin-like protein [Testicularia cyperi]|uniref:Glutathione S-transferase kappa n=1 Tax=Testicularia cyperi TaxID=1882483 RepID=A0A317XVG1_9BASI|nr:thioredoxin-like protein [Testicularia cyperi]
MNKVQFYFDCVSPWSYVAFQVIRRYQSAWNLDITYKPINLGYVMKYSGNKPPISVPNKGAWMWGERDRAAVFYGVTLNPTKEFPINTQYVQTFLRTVSDLAPSELERAIEVMYAAIWHDDLPVATLQDLDAIVSKSSLFKQTQGQGQGGGSIKDQILEKAFAKETKVNLAKESQDLAENKGAFGMPWIITTRAKDGKEQAWFGSDRFEQIAAWLHVPYKGPFADGSVAKL